MGAVLSSFSASFVQAQKRDSRDTVSSEFRQLQNRAATALLFRQWPQVQAFFDRQTKVDGSALEPWKQATFQEAQGSPESPSLLNESILLQKLSSVEASCPPEVIAITSSPVLSKKLQKDFVVPPHANFESWASCLWGYEVIYARSARWSRLREAYLANPRDADSKQRDIRGLLTLLKSQESMLAESTSPEPASAVSLGLQNACQELKGWLQGQDLEFRLNCDGHVSLSELKTEYERSKRVVKKNPMIQATADGASKIMRLPVRASERMASQIQSVLDSYWNLAPELQIRIVRVERGPALRIVETMGAIPSANRVAGDEIYLDPLGDAQMNERALAHELGHILGFMDGYTEIWRAEDETAIYYEVESQNLMSSFSGAVLPMHIQALIETY